MKNKLKLGDARALLQLLEGENVASSRLSEGITAEMLTEHLLIVMSRGSRRTLRTDCPDDIRLWLYQQYHVDDLAHWIESHGQPASLSRAEQVRTFGDSKNSYLRSFRGFLVNVCEPLQVRINDTSFLLQPQAGMAHYVEDFMHFSIDGDVVVVCIENGENFQHLSRQRHLFPAGKVLFVSRYPQSTDLRDWLTRIPNRYIHFGDFDLAGIFIFLDEFYRFLGNRAEFFVPADIETRLSRGSRTLYNQQLNKYRNRPVADERVLPLVQMIHQYGRAYEQEGYIEDVGL